MQKALKTSSGKTEEDRAYCPVYKQAKPGRTPLPLAGSKVRGAIFLDHRRAAKPCGVSVKR